MKGGVWGYIFAFSGSPSQTQMILFVGHLIGDGSP